MSRNNFPRHAGFGFKTAKYSDFNLTSRDGLFKDDPFVVSKCLLSRCYDLVNSVCLTDADGRTHIGGLDE